nr:hypothetical protein GZ9E5_43 [uncultured archaeon GZfos9E5]
MFVSSVLICVYNLFSVILFGIFAGFVPFCSYALHLYWLSISRASCICILLPPSTVPAIHPTVASGAHNP